MNGYQERERKSETALFHCDCDAGRKYKAESPYANNEGSRQGPPCNKTIWLPRLCDVGLLQEQYCTAGQPTYNNLD